jgi:hypothetical protein
MHHIHHKLLILSLCSLPAGTAFALDELDVTIRVIDRQEARLENFTNRIELPRELAPHPGTGARDQTQRERNTGPGPVRPGGGEGRAQPGDGRPQFWDRSRTGPQQSIDMRENARQLGDDSRHRPGETYGPGQGGGYQGHHEAEYLRQPPRR